MPAKITHVAIIFNEQVWSLPRPYRHHHIIRTIATLDTSVKFVDTLGDKQGFLDEDGKYLNRRDALIRARLTDQILDQDKIYAGELFSENLW